MGQVSDQNSMFKKATKMHNSMLLRIKAANADISAQDLGRNEPQG